LADRKKIVDKDGAHRTNRVTVEPGSVPALGYQIETLGGEEIGSTGRLKVLRIGPSDERSTEPRFLGRWDDGPAQRLDFDLVDKDDQKAHRRKLPYWHHPKVIETTDGHRRYLVEIGRNEKHIVFRGVVAVAIRFRLRLGAVTKGVVTVEAKVIR
jgi:hypothetical protein